MKCKTLHNSSVLQVKIETFYNPLLPGGSESCYFPVTCYSCLEKYGKYLKAVTNVKPVIFSSNTTNLKNLLFPNETCYSLWSSYT